MLSLLSNCKVNKMFGIPFYLLNKKMLSSLFSTFILSKAMRDVAVYSVVGAMPSTFSSARLDRAKKHRAMPYAI